MNTLLAKTNKGNEFKVSTDTIEGYLKVNMQDGDKGKYLALPFNLLKDTTYANKSNGKVVNTFTLKGIKNYNGMYYKGGSYFYKGKKINPSDYLYPNGDTPAWSIALGSDEYDKIYSGNGAGYIPTGVNLTNPKYTPGNEGYGQGNDILSYVTGNDGRKYTAQLTNLTYTNADVWNADFNTPILFYQDPGTDTWCQYFAPINQMILDKSLLEGNARIWSGSFYQFKEDTNLSGHQFYKDEVLYLFVTPNFSATEPRSLFGVPFKKEDNIIFWAVAKDFNHLIHTGGVIEGDTNWRGDPRMYFEDGKLCFICNGGCGIPNAVFTRFTVDVLNERGTAVYKKVLYRDSSFGLYSDKSKINYECPAPVIVNGVKVFGYCEQVVGATSGEWNTIRNNNFFQVCKDDWSSTDKPQPFDIGYDSYAVILSNDNGRYYYNTTAFNWGIRVNGKFLYPYISGSYPFKEFVFNPNKKFKLLADTSTWRYTKFNGRDITYLRDGNQTIKIKFDGGMYLDIDNATKGEFLFQDVVDHTKNSKATIKPEEVIGVYYKQHNHFLEVIIKTVDTAHDTMCNIYFKQPGEYKVV